MCTCTGKWKAVVTEIKRMNKSGRPVLVGTTSVEKSEMLAARLKEAEISCQVRLPDATMGKCAAKAMHLTLAFKGQASNAASKVASICM